MYNVKTNRWYEMAPLKHARMGSAAAHVDGKIYVFGGIGRRQECEDDESKERGDDGTVLSSVEVYLPREDRWDTSVNLPVGRCFAVALHRRQFVFLIGGVQVTDDRSGKCVAHVDAFKPMWKKWTRMWQLDHPRHSVAVLNHGGCVLIIGGLSPEKRDAFDTVECYDIETRAKLKNGTPMPTRLSGFAFVQVPTALSYRLKEITTIDAGAV